LGVGADGPPGVAAGWGTDAGPLAMRRHYENGRRTGTRRRPGTVPAVRTVLGLVAGAAVAVLGALILGEYEFTGSLPYVAGPLFGLAIGEVVVALRAARAPATALATALLGFAGITWAGWIDSGEGVEPFKTAVWVAAVLAALMGFVRVWGLRSTPR